MSSDFDQGNVNFKKLSFMMHFDMVPSSSPKTKIATTIAVCVFVPKF